ncbi:hypothetical protein [Streptomyces sp. NPDC005141]
MSDEQWALIEPVLTAWKNRHRSVSGLRAVTGRGLSAGQQHHAVDHRDQVGQPRQQERQTLADAAP